MSTSFITIAIVKGLHGARILAAIGRAPIIVQSYRHQSAAADVRSRRIRQPPVGGHFRLHSEQPAVVVRDDEVRRLPGLVRRSHADLVAHPATVWGPVPWRTFWSAPLVKLGASFTGVTVMLTVAVLLSVMSSVALKVKLSGRCSPRREILHLPQASVDGAVRRRGYENICYSVTVGAVGIRRGRGNR